MLKIRSMQSLFIAAGLAWAGSGFGAVGSLVVGDVVHVDLPAAAAAAAKAPQRYATNVLHAASLDSVGTWLNEGHLSTWTYTVTVPGAANLAFRASTLRLPEGAQLFQSDEHGNVVAYTPAQLAQGQLWSRVSKGSTLTLKLVVPASERAGALLVIDSIQPGFADPGAAGSAHAVPMATSSGPTYSCAENYSCNVLATNSSQARSSVGITINNTTFCTATLVSDLAGDLKMYFITAAHCGVAADAPSINFYWQAKTACGSTLQSVYTAAVTTSSGATSRMQHEDTWLVEASTEAPAGARPYWTGVDASDTDVTTGTSFTIHYAQQFAAQYIESSQALAKGLTTSKSTPAWLLTNTKGSTAPGASGAALVGPGGRQIGNLAGGINACPGTGSANGSITYQRLGTVWTGGATSATSLKSWLDPSNTGSKTTNGREDPDRAGTPVVGFSASPASITQGDSSTLTWTSSQSEICALSPDSQVYRERDGTLVVSPSTTTVYTLSCTSSDGNVTAVDKTVTVTAPPPGGGGGGGSTPPEGGGGSLPLATLVVLLAAGIVRRRHHAK